MKNKKALSHIEIMISFAVFIGFLISFYIIIEPAIKGPKSSGTILQDLSENILSQISDEVSSYNITLSWNEDNPGVCTVIGECIRIENSANKNVSVIGKKEVDYYNNITGHISIWCRTGICEREDVFTIYYADSFSMKKDSDCQWGLDSECYSTKFQKKRDYIFESKVNALKDKYSAYESLKQELEIPAKYEFWFDFLDEEGVSKFNEWTEPDIPENVNIYADKISITYILINNQNPEDKKNGFLVIKMWG